MTTEMLASFFDSWEPVRASVLGYLDACDMADPDDPFMRRVLAHVGQYDEDKGR